MKCARCGAELKQGCLYCSVCGYESQILPDYNMLEDEYLRSLLKEENKPKQTEKKAITKTVGTKERKRAKETKQTKETNGSRMFYVCMGVLGVLAVLGVAAGIGVKSYMDAQNANSYEYQMKMAREEEASGNYDNALNFYNRALTLRQDDKEARLSLADIYWKKKNYDAALVLYMEIIKMDRANRTAYEKLISIYEEKKDYDSILALADEVQEPAILELFQPYLVTPPIISPLGGDYDEALVITLFSLKGEEIYYTLDGTVPDEENGIFYRNEEIAFQETGNYQIRAACINDKGISSEIVEAEYYVEIKPPGYPLVTPDGGEIWEETYVTITAEENCSIYYTWDGNDPTEASEKYTEPLLVPVGNHVLSVLVVNDENGLKSGIYRSNFIYLP